MSMPEKLIIMQKCFNCKRYKSEKCGDQEALKGCSLFSCPQYIDYRSKDIVTDDSPFKIIKKKVRVK
jgi:hypothetical protein